MPKNILCSHLLTKTFQFENLDTLLNDMHSEDMHTSIGI